MAYFEEIMNGLTQPAPMRPAFGSLAVKPPAATPVAPPAPVPGQRMAQAAPAASGFEDMATFLAGMGEGGGALLPALGAGARAVTMENKRREAVNQTRDFLLRNGLAPEDVDATMANPDLLRLKLGQIFKPAPQAPAGFAMRPDGTMTFVPGGPEDPATIEAQTKARAAAQGSSGVQYGSTPYWTQDGRPYVMGSDGSAKFVDLGDAKPLAPGELATEKARGAATGKAMGEAKAALPAVVQSTAETLGLLDSLAEDKYLDSMVGAIGGRTPDLTEDANRVAAKMAQVSGTAFLTAFQKLRGGGQITEVEGRKATEAISRLENRKQSPAAYKAAIEDLRRIARNGLIRAQVDAGQLPPDALNQLHNFETVQDIVAPPPPGPSAPPAAMREVPQPQSTNPRAPGYNREAPPAPNNFNPRGQGYAPPTRTLDAGDGFTVKVK